MLFKKLFSSKTKKETAAEDLGVIISKPLAGSSSAEDEDLAFVFTNSWEPLSLDVFEYILSFLAIKHLYKVTCVSKKLKKLVTWKYVTHISFYDESSTIHHVTDDLVSNLLPRMSHVQHLAVPFCRRLTAVSFTKVANTLGNQLLSLDVSHVPKFQEALGTFATKAENLEKLVLAYNYVQFSTLVTKFPKLKCLRVVDNRAEGMADFLRSHADTLEELVIKRCTLPVDVMKALPTLKKLKVLNLSRCTIGEQNYSISSLLHLSNAHLHCFSWPRLQVLDLSDAQLSADFYATTLFTLMESEEERRQGAGTTELTTVRLPNLDRWTIEFGYLTKLSPKLQAIEVQRMDRQLIQPTIEKLGNRVEIIFI